ncbi:MAG: hypothetical protein VX589_08755 [Myxococcota bacterium]|nr:hypothetical protein [Myxococcota bacterium]
MGRCRCDLLRVCRPHPMTVEINYRWLICLLSLIIMVCLRNHLIWMTAYATFCLMTMLTYVIILPRVAGSIYRRLHLQTLQSTSDDALRECEQALRKARWLKNSPYGYAFWDLSAVIAFRQGHVRRAIACWRTALRSAPRRDLGRIRTNLDNALKQRLAEENAGHQPTADRGQS